MTYRCSASKAPPSIGQHKPHAFHQRRRFDLTEIVDSGHRAHSYVAACWKLNDASSTASIKHGPSNHRSMLHLLPPTTPPRRRKMIGHRRRVEDEGEEDGGVDHLDVDDDSLTEGSLASDDHDPADDSDTSNIDEASPTSPAVRKATGRANNGNGAAKRAKAPASADAAKPAKLGAAADTEFMLNRLSISDQQPPESVKEMDLDNAAESESPSKSSAPIVVSSSSAVMDQPQGAPQERRRREHDEYRRKRDEDPSFVPNRGAFFMHDHRHAGPAANGFRPFGRGGRGGRGRGGAIGGPFTPFSHQLHNPADPITNSPWAHDMHETVAAEPIHFRHPRHIAPLADDGPPNGDGFIPTCPSNSTPINRTLSTEKRLGNVQIRVYIPPLKEPIVFSGIPIKQYTKLPDHRPPLRRDKPVRISLPNFAPRYIFPATDRSFIFIPRAMRPNQQRMRGKPRSGLGSIGGFSRRTSVFGGSYYNGSNYSPSIALSRRSSIAPDMGRDFIVSPTGSAISRPPMPLDAPRPVVRLPPRVEPQLPAVNGTPGEGPPAFGQTAINELPQPQTHPLPQKPTFQENKSVPIPMHQPRPQKTVSLENIESPTMQQHPQSYQQAFHHQVPVQVSNGFGQESHACHPSYPSHHSTGTPLSQIPERAIHAAPFQPTQYSQQSFYPPYQVMPSQQNFYYPPPAPYAAGAPPFVPGAQQGQPQNDANQANSQTASGSNLVAQEVNGMVYYYDATQLPPPPPPPPMAAYPPYSAPQGYPAPGGVMSLNGIVTPSPDGFYYPQPGVYYPQ
ncbi:CASC3/Barentsz eIF4AIII binding-domain-containing protein [Pseudomassariella vexata]|uniref:CASC3/Barentsz eIF4AIII binding-domain-containing protein n=1 Tax=Pseudomassariella vexata TaxID=1141098 RepID=A0A1Y2DDH2_9PEZI|nr:CASC3/Barentsz eIF4AIII binding-domain-containing protein [Pseudomassariella vexata]ORY57289.1 CASC3/Barentsz eIF4AIII binding-domain-containing protein [Pseudomassariella vexata]